MLRMTGRVDSASLAASISAISRGFGLQGQPLGTVVTALGQGLQQSTNPVIQALQLSAMNRAMPGANLWQMEMAMENPLANKRYITGFLGQLKGMSGGDTDQYARSIYNVFGQYGISKTIADKMARGELTPEMFAKKLPGAKETGEELEKRAIKLFGSLETLTSLIQGGFEKQGFGGGTEKYVGELSLFLKGVVGEVKEGAAAVKKAALKFELWTDRNLLVAEKADMQNATATEHLRLANDTVRLTKEIKMIMNEIAKK